LDKWQPDFKIERKRRKLLADLASGKILDIGYNEFPNDFLEGAIGFDREITREPKNYKKLIKGDCQKLSRYFKESSFDTIIVGEVLEHLENPSALLREAKKVLKDDGILLISIPNPYNVLTIVANSLFLKPSYGSQISLFSFRTMTELLNHTGWNCEKLINASGGINIWPKNRRVFLPFIKPFCYQFIYVIRKS